MKSRHFNLLYSKISLFIPYCDYYFSVSGLILSSILMFFLYGSGKVFYAFVMVFPIISFFLWLKIRKNASIDVRDMLYKHKYGSRLLSIIYWTAFTIAHLVLLFRYDQYQRPLSYFILIALCALIVLIESFHSNRRYENHILVQILLIGGSLVLSQFILFPDLLGIDPWSHRALTMQVVENGHLPTDGYSYSFFPLFHILIATASLLLDVDYRMGTFISISLIQIICNTLFIYLIAKKIFKSSSVNLVAALFLVLGNVHIMMCYWPIPNSFAGIYLPILAYLIIQINQCNKKIIFSGILFLVSLAIIFSHTIASMFAAILFFISHVAISLYNKIFTKANFTTIIMPIAFTVAMYSWWIFTSGRFETLVEIIQNQFSSEYFVKLSDVMGSMSYVTPLIEKLFNYVGFFVYFSLSIIGVLFIFKNRNFLAENWIHGMIITLFTITPLSLGFFTLIFGMSIIQDRWFYFAQLFAPVLVAVALLILYNRCTKPILIVLFALASFLFIFSLIINPTANVDNHQFSPHSSMTYALKESEISGVSTFSEHYDGIIKTDSLLAGTMKFDGYHLSPFCNELEKNILAEVDKLVIIRESTISHPFKIYSALYNLKYDYSLPLFQSSNLIYDNDRLYIFKNG